jgi:hypothetical protein
MKIDAAPFSQPCGALQESRPPATASAFRGGGWPERGRRPPPCGWSTRGRRRAGRRWQTVARPTVQCRFAAQGPTGATTPHARGRRPRRRTNLAGTTAAGPPAPERLRQDEIPVEEEIALSGLRIVAVTGSSPAEYDLTHGPGGIDRWIRKPIDPASLLRELKNELDAVAGLA